jgi:hypothetical protein
MIVSAFDTPGGAVGGDDGQAGAVQVGDARPEAHVDAHAAQPVLGVPRQVGWKGGRTRSAASSRRIRLVEGAMLRNSPRSVRLASSAICPAISTPVGPAPTTTKVSARATSAGVVAELGTLEGGEDAAAQLQGVVDGLHARGELGEVVVAEVRLPGACGDHQAVVGQRRRGALAGEREGAGVGVDVQHVPEQDAGVRLTAQDLAGGGCDLALGQDAGGHLVQQRLEQVVDGPADQRDVDVGVRELLDGEEAAEAGAHDDDVVAGVRGGAWGAGVHAVSFPSRGRCPGRCGGGRSDAARAVLVKPRTIYYVVVAGHVRVSFAARRHGRCDAGPRPRAHRATVSSRPSASSVRKLMVKAPSVAPPCRW